MMKNVNSPASVPVTPQTRCCVCGWSATDLRDTGRMGCAACYGVFVAMVEQAVAELHRAPVESPPPVDKARAASPWPTRTAR